MRLNVDSVLLVTPIQTMDVLIKIANDIKDKQTTTIKTPLA